MLQRFIATDKQCNWPGCCNQAVKTQLPVVSRTKHCLKHQLYKHSGRVGPNWKRDHYRQHLGSVCEISKTTWCETYQHVKQAMLNLKPQAERYEVVRRTCQQFDVDHVDGFRDNNCPSNLQTLTKQMHKLKTDVVGDANPWRNKK